MKEKAKKASTTICSTSLMFLLQGRSAFLAGRFKLRQARGDQPHCCDFPRPNNFQTVLRSFAHIFQNVIRASQFALNIAENHKHISEIFKTELISAETFSETNRS